MRITYPNAYRLWSSLHRANPRRLFLATEEQPRLGEQVPVELCLPATDHSLKWTMEVVERRAAGGRFPAGIFVNLSDEQYQACRAYLGIAPLINPPAPHRVSGTGGDVKKPRAAVLVGDDDRDILEFLERALTRFHVDVTGVSDGVSALKLVRELRPRLVVLDVVMPGMDGTEVCRKMRSDEALAAIPVVLVSALDKDELDAVADQAGANDCLAKPVDLAHLLNTVGEYLRD